MRDNLIRFILFEFLNHKNTTSKQPTFFGNQFPHQLIEWLRLHFKFLFVNTEVQVSNYQSIKKFKSGRKKARSIAQIPLWRPFAFRGTTLTKTSLNGKPSGIHEVAWQILVVAKISNLFKICQPTSEIGENDEFSAFRNRGNVFGIFAEE